jgi:hypothetical protein
MPKQLRSSEKRRHSYLLPNGPQLEIHELAFSMSDKSPIRSSSWLLLIWLFQQNPIGWVSLISGSLSLVKQPDKQELAKTHRL